MDQKTGGRTAAVASYATFSLTATGIDTIPSGACVRGVALTITTESTAAGGNLIIYADGRAPGGTTSGYNYPAGLTHSELVFAPVGADGKIEITNSGSGTAQIIGDLAGYYPCTG